METEMPEGAKATAVGAVAPAEPAGVPSASEVAPGAAPVRELPVWLSTLFVLLFLGAGAGFAWWYVTAPVRTKSGVVGAPDVASQRGWAAARATGPGRGAAPQQFVRLAGNKYRMETPSVWMEVPKDKNDPAALSVDFMRRDLLYTPEQKDTVLAAIRIQGDMAVQQLLNVTPEQVKKLRAIPSPPFALTAGERKQLWDLWSAYQSAAEGKAKDEAEQKLSTALNQFGDKALASAKQAAAERAEAVKKVLTAEQLEGYGNMGALSAKKMGK